MARTPTDDRIRRLEEHLRDENPELAGAVRSFQELDQVARRLGLMAEDDSFATQVSWWPVIAVLGTFSAGKSTFLNQYVGRQLQRTGNQAVDDKFTVICYGHEDIPQVLPGLALDSDPRFPFYQISKDIEGVAEGEGRRVDSYLQLKTCNAESLRGKILIDSPGFDADKQRSSTLLITDHIINLSDLVLVFFDARHPEPGAMGDTLKHLVGDTVHRPDASKFLYILNQIDTTAREDNPEEVVAAWQRALAQYNLIAGRFYRIYAKQQVVTIDDEQVRRRLETKRDEDLAEIENRIQQVEVERAYRVVGVLEKTAKHIRDELVPRLAEARKQWRRRSLWLNLAVFGLLLLAFVTGTLASGAWDGLRFTPYAELDLTLQVFVAVLLLGVALWLYQALRRLAGSMVLRRLRKDESLGRHRDAVIRAFRFNMRGWWHPLSSNRPRGWSNRSRRKLEAVIVDADRFIQALNDRYASPSGRGGRAGGSPGEA